MTDIESIRTWQTEYLDEYSEYRSECEVINRLLDWFEFVDRTYPIVTWQEVTF